MAESLISRLHSGEEVKFRPHGNSMMPHIKSGALVTLAPITDPDTQLVPRAIVYATVRGRKFLHFISAVRDGQYQIANANGHINGWTTAKQVHGILVNIEP